MLQEEFFRPELKLAFVRSSRFFPPPHVNGETEWSEGWALPQRKEKREHHEEGRPKPNLCPETFLPCYHHCCDDCGAHCFYTSGDVDSLCRKIVDDIFFLGRSFLFIIRTLFVCFKEASRINP